MNNLIKILLVGLAIFHQSHGQQTAINVPLASGQQSEQELSARNVQIIRDIKTYIQENPHLSLIRLHKKKPLSRSQSVKYSLGNRVADDRLVSQYADTFFYPAPKDVSVQVTYPVTGIGSVVTAVDINCLQDNTDGNAYVVGGGIGQRFISIVLEAPQTERFSYNVHVYGVN